MKDKLNEFLNAFGLYCLLKLIFENNYFIFNDKFYRQLTGVAMECKCGPSIANLYVYLLEKHWLSTINDLIFFARFIDDILITSTVITQIQATPVL
jgi:hypothetical protein